MGHCYLRSKGYVSLFLRADLSATQEEGKGGGLNS